MKFIKYFVFFWLLILPYCHAEMECVYPNSDIKAPLWVCDEPVEGIFVSAVGRAEKSAAGINFMKQMAAVEARIGLAQSMKIYAANTLKQYAQTTGAVDFATLDEITSSVTKYITNETLAGTKIFQSIQRPDGEMYVLLGLDQTATQRMIEKSIKTSMHNDPVLWQKIQAGKSADAMASEIALSDIPVEPIAIEKPVFKQDTNPPQLTITSPVDSRALKSVQSSIVISGNTADESGVSEVTINGEAVDFDTRGNFTQSLRTKMGVNRFEVIAIDTKGNEAKRIVTFNRESTPVIQQDATSDIGIGKKYALVIGINSYKNGINSLKTAVNDAKEVSDVLERLYGFETTLMLDASATKDSILETIEAISQKTKPNDQFLIYYAGHGYFEKETDTSYWLPSDAKSNSFVKGIKSKDITDFTKMAKAKQILIVADSCYSGTIDRAVNIKWDTMNETRANFLKKQLKEPSRILLSSGGNEPVGDGSGKHSVFANQFIKKLKNFDKNVFTAQELYSSYKEAISGNSDQTPEYKSIKASGHESGDFIFIKR